MKDSWDSQLDAIAYRLDSFHVTELLELASNFIIVDGLARR